MFIKLHGRALDITGQRFGLLTALGPVQRIQRNAGTQIKWLCVCDCGAEVSVALGDLRSGQSKSCGCGVGASARARLTKHGKANSAEYHVWRGMRDRCEQPSHGSYRNYGGKGVKVCERWKNFANFLADMGPRPSSEHTIDRLKSSGDYEPENCRWATRKEQAANTSRNLVVSAFGRTGPLASFVNAGTREYGRARERIVKLGWDAERALSDIVGDR